MDLTNVSPTMEKEINRFLNELCVEAIDAKTTGEKFSRLVSHLDTLLSQDILSQTEAEEIANVLQRAQDALNRKLSASGTQVVQPAYDSVTNFIFHVCMRKLKGLCTPNELHISFV
jgi:hypothetical protein